MNATSHRKLRRAATLLANAAHALAAAVEAEQHDGDRRRIAQIHDETCKTLGDATQLHQRHE